MTNHRYNFRIELCTHGHARNRCNEPVHIPIGRTTPVWYCQCCYKTLTTGPGFCVLQCRDCKPSITTARTAWA